MYHLRGGDFRTSLQYATRSSTIAGTLGDAGATALAHALMGISLHLVGNLNEARIQLEAALEPGPDSPTSRTTYLGFDRYRFSSTALTTTLWLQGHPTKATALAYQLIKDAERMYDPASLAIMLNSVALLLWTGDLDFAEQQLDGFISRAESQYFGPYLDVGYGLRGELAICRGEVKAGIEMLRSCLEKLHAARYGFFTTRFHAGLAGGLAASGQFLQAAALVDEAIRWTEAKGDTSYLPELLRLKGSILLAMPQSRIEDAEACFTQSLELSRVQGSRAWELRTATDLAALWVGQGRANEARALLLPVFEHFTEGSDTADLKTAGRLLATLS